MLYFPQLPAPSLGFISALNNLVTNSQTPGPPLKLRVIIVSFLDFKTIVIKGSLNFFFLYHAFYFNNGVDFSSSPFYTLSLLGSKSES